jgi:Tfp pilus assembly protein PilX
VTHAARARRDGFALPLALFMLTIIALLAALLLQGSIDELRVARGEVAAARAQAAAGSALADVLAAIPDSAVLARPRGTITPTVIAAGPETTRVSVQSLGGGLVRVTAGARVWSGGVRADASNAGFFRIVADPAGMPGSLRYQRLPGWWWTQIP